MSIAQKKQANFANRMGLGNIFHSLPFVWLSHSGTHNSMSHNSSPTQCKVLIPLPFVEVLSSEPPSVAQPIANGRL
jgi:hypothetical protein